MTSSSAAKTLPLFTGAEKKHGDRFFNKVEKNSRQRGPQRTNALQTVWLLLEWVVRSFIAFKEQGVINLWTTLGLVGIKVKFQVSSTF